MCAPSGEAPGSFTGYSPAGNCGGPLRPLAAAGAGRGYVAQDYSEGRITFVDLAEGTPQDGGDDFTARTITGFELSAGIVVGPDQ